MKLFFCLLLSFSFCTIRAQNCNNDSLKQVLIREWVRAKSYTQEYLAAMPADKYSFRPTDSMRSFSEQMLHLAAANAGLGFIGTSAKYPFSSQNFDKSPSLQNRDSVLYYVNTSYDYVINAIRNLDAGKLNEVVSWDVPGGRQSFTRLVWLMKTFEHQTHHRGQCTVYLRLSGIKPPAEKLF